VGSLLKGAGFLLGTIIVVANLIGFNAIGAPMMIGVAGAILGVMIGLLFYAAGMHVSIVGSQLSATLDNAVNSSSFLTNDQKATIIGL
jgi:hypothetical protein